MTHIELDSRNKSVDDLLRQLRLALKAPAWSGENLDALADVLTAEAKGPITLVWRHSHSVANASQDSAAQDRGARLRSVLEDAAQQRDDIRLLLI